MALFQTRQGAGSIWVAEAPNWTGSSDEILKIGIPEKTIEARAGRGQSWQIGQMYGVVGPELISAKYVFKGLKRKMYVGDDRGADQLKLAVSWKATQDSVYRSGEEGGYLDFYPAPENRVFVVYISVNRMVGEFSDIYGWAEHWTWVEEDPSKSGAPVEWSDRYEALLWDRDGL